MALLSHPVPFDRPLHWHRGSCSRRPAQSSFAARGIMESQSFRGARAVTTVASTPDCARFRTATKRVENLLNVSVARLQVARDNEHVPDHLDLGDEDSFRNDPCDRSLNGSRRAIAWSADRSEVEGRSSGNPPERVRDRRPVWAFPRRLSKLRPMAAGSTAGRFSFDRTRCSATLARPDRCSTTKKGAARDDRGPPLGDIQFVRSSTTSAQRWSLWAATQAASLPAAARESSVPRSSGSTNRRF